MYNAFYDTPYLFIKHKHKKGSDKVFSKKNYKKYYVSNMKIRKVYTKYRRIEIRRIEAHQVKL